ncbi:hypothetical protein CY34DRAFT_811130 [Suillus luteus UH-Slu-Lm8-n1]|uniref:Uncharacterized protein n=1 Tax=Suillus luteus UH-Slu-Lm8-n1 TaxID=930992 RepID=A0A0D0A4U0_9AGAM|nr:hypothetical protein CY34DRAFT_811130 [Suillus luteus UH-Slu-Lm8-n1]
MACKCMCYYFYPVAIQTNLKHSSRSTLQDSSQHRSLSVSIRVFVSTGPQVKLESE